MEGDQGTEGKAGLCHCHERRHTVRARRHLGELERAGLRRVDSDLREPLVLAPADYARWLGDQPDPRDLMQPFPSELMRMWQISTRVNKPEDYDPSIVEPIELRPDATWAVLANGRLKLLLQLLPDAAPPNGAAFRLERRSTEA